MNTSMIDENDVPVTGAMLELIDILHHARSMFVAEASLADELGKPLPDQDWWTRCKSLYFDTYADHAKQIGLHLNEITFRSLMFLEIPNEIMETEFDELSEKYAFNPWLGMGKGGFKTLTSDEPAAQDRYARANDVALEASRKIMQLMADQGIADIPRHGQLQAKIQCEIRDRLMQA